MPYTAIVDPVAMADMLSVLEPLGHVVHIVLIGLGAEILRYQHSGAGAIQTKQKGQVSRLLAGRRRDEEEDSGRASLSSGGEADYIAAADAEDSQLGAMAMALMKHGFPYVSVLEGGYSAVIKYLLSCDGRGIDDEGEGEEEGDLGDGNAVTPLSKREKGDLSLGLHVLVDVDHAAISVAFQRKPSVPTAPTPPPSTPLSDVSSSLAPSTSRASLAVTDMISSTYGLFKRRSLNMWSLFISVGFNFVLIYILVQLGIWPVLIRSPTVAIFDKSDHRSLLAALVFQWILHK
jgi:hypothetical protein